MSLVMFGYKCYYSNELKIAPESDFEQSDTDTDEMKADAVNSPV